MALVTKTIKLALIRARSLRNANASFPYRHVVAFPMNFFGHT